jgi:hypothetical protein
MKEIFKNTDFVQKLRSNRRKGREKRVWKRILTMLENIFICRIIIAMIKQIFSCWIIPVCCRMNRVWNRIMSMLEQIFLCRIMIKKIFSCWMTPVCCRRDGRRIEALNQASSSLDTQSRTLFAVSPNRMSLEVETDSTSSEDRGPGQV